MQLITLVGPTAVGKSATAWWLAEKILADGYAPEVWVVSADSRQVYQGLEVITGVDIPAGFSKRADGPLGLAWYRHGKLALAGVSMIAPDQDWSVAHFQQYLYTVFQAAESVSAQVIVVGGTGLYHHQAQQSDHQLHIPPNETLRETLSVWPVEELQTELKRLDTATFEAMTHSDQLNPRRLMRAIEKAVFLQQENAGQPVLAQGLSSNVVSVPNLTIGFKSDLSLIKQRITERVAQRWSQGALQEVERLEADFPVWTGPAFTATGVKELRALADGLTDQETALALWARRELQYAKRQLTWWKKYSPDVWFDVTEQSWQDAVWQYILKTCLVSSAVKIK